MRIKPLRDQVFLVPIEEKLDSGIVLPDTTKKENTQKGEVFAVGPDCSIKKGDKVVFTASPIKVKLAETEYLVVREEDIVAKID